MVQSSWPHISTMEMCRLEASISIFNQTNDLGRRQFAIRNGRPGGHVNITNMSTNCENFSLTIDLSPHFDENPGPRVGPEGLRGARR